MADPVIYDQFNRPIQRRALERAPLEIASVAQIRRWQDSVATGLNPERLARILRDNDSGDTLDMLGLAVEMEERDLHYFAQVQDRITSVSGAPVRVEPGGDFEFTPEDAKGNATKRKASTKAQEIAAAFEHFVVKTPHFRWLLDDLMDAVTKTYSVVQPIWDTTSKPWRFTAFKHHDPRCFMWERDRLDALQIRVDGQLEGRPIPPGVFLVHYPRIRTGVKLRGGIARLAAINYLFKVHTVADWLTFAEVYGMPLRIGRYNPQTASDDEKRAMRRALLDLGHDAAAMVPSGMDIEILDARRPTSGDNLFKGLADYFDEHTSKAINGQTTSSDAKAKGIGTGESDQHNRTRQHITEADALSCGATIQEIARIWTQFNYGVDAPVPLVSVDVKPPEDKAAKATTLKTVAESIASLKTAGKRITNETIQEEYGISLEDIPEAELNAEAERERLKRPEPPAGSDGKQVSGKPAKPAKPGARPAPNAATEDESIEFVEDELSSLLANWEELLSPHQQAIEAAAREAGSYADFEERLKTLAADVDSDPLVRAMAIAAMKARGLAADVN